MNFYCRNNIFFLVSNLLFTFYGVKWNGIEKSNFLIQELFMKVPVEKFTKEERYWYAQLMCKAVLVDRKIEMDELDFLLKPFYYLDEDQKETLRAALKEKDIPDNMMDQIPKGFDAKILAAILTEVALLTVSDVALPNNEKSFLRVLLLKFGFPESVVSPFMKWVKSALKLEEDRRQLVAHAAWKHEIERQKK